MRLVEWHVIYKMLDENNIKLAGNVVERKREYHELTEISLQQLGRTGAQTRNEVQ